MSTGWVRYLFGFEGRISRLKMWAFVASRWAWRFSRSRFRSRSSSCAAAARAGPAGGFLRAHDAVALAPWCALGVFPGWTTFAVSAKRLHDRDKSAWWLLFFSGAPIAAMVAAKVLRSRDPRPQFVDLPFLAVFQVVVLWCWIETLVLPGTRGANASVPIRSLRNVRGSPSSAPWSARRCRAPG